MRAPGKTHEAVRSEPSPCPFCQTEVGPTAKRCPQCRAVMGRRSLFAGRTKSIRPDWREWGLPVVTVLWLLTMLSLISLSSRAVILVAGTGFVVLAIFFRWESVFVAVKILLILNALRGLTILIAARMNPHPWVIAYGAAILILSLLLAYLVHYNEE